MGASHSQPTWLSDNDFELVLRSAKELEVLLRTEFGAVGNGLHELCNTSQIPLRPELVKRIRYLATLRNKLVHDIDYNKLDDRATFVAHMTESRKELLQIVADLRARANKQRAAANGHARTGAGAADDGAGQCTIS